MANSLLLLPFLTSALMNIQQYLPRLSQAHQQDSLPISLPSILRLQQHLLMTLQLSQMPWHLFQILPLLMLIQRPHSWMLLRLFLKLQLHSLNSSLLSQNSLHLSRLSWHLSQMLLQPRQIPPHCLQIRLLQMRIQQLPLQKPKPTPDQCGSKRLRFFALLPVMRSEKGNATDSESSHEVCRLPSA